MGNRTRRDFLGDMALAAVLTGCSRSPGTLAGNTEQPAGPADVTLRIGPILADIADGHTIGTIAYNGSVPGPHLQFVEV